MDRLTVIVTDPVRAMLIKIGSYVPVIAGALLILVAGWLIAKMIETILVRVLRVMRIDNLSDKAGISKILAQGDIKLTLSEILGAIVYWLVMLVAIVTTLNALNLTTAANLMSRLVAYVPNIIAAIFVLVLGSFLANFVSAIVRTSASNAGIKNAKLLGQITQIILVIFAIAIAVEQLKVAAALVGIAVNIILASIGLGVAIAFGLGCKDLAAKAMSDLISKMKK